MNIIKTWLIHEQSKQSRCYWIWASWYCKDELSLTSIQRPAQIGSTMKDPSFCCSCSNSPTCCTTAHVFCSKKTWQFLISRNQGKNNFLLSDSHFLVIKKFTWGKWVIKLIKFVIWKESIWGIRNSPSHFIYATQH